jgi:REP element-mobilizing transposase RayT
MQHELPFKNTWGGPRKNAGRRASEDSGVSHLRRDELASRYPVHVTVRLKPGLPNLRRFPTLKELIECFAAGRHRFGFRLNHYSVQSNHLHLIVEAEDRKSLSRGIQGLLIRIAKTLNRLWRRKGSIFADRYHDRILKTPRQVRNALAYVLCNAARHRTYAGRPDFYSSGTWFDGWKEKLEAWLEVATRPVVPARTWLQKKGWRRRGRISLRERPGKSEAS